MAKERIYIVNSFQRAVDFLLIIFIIALLVGVAAKTFIPYRETAKLCQVLGAPFMTMRFDMMVSHALRGDWPQNDQEAMKDGWAEEYYKGGHNNAFIKSAAIEDGAIHFQLQSIKGERMLTMRPAVPAIDPLGPVVWICGQPTSPALWSLPGVDKTNIDYRYIPESWR